jgi:hypothetical protein
MNYKFPVIELFDRLAIAEIKWQRTAANSEELTWYQNQTKDFDTDSIKEAYEQLKDIHNKIWNLEAELKSGQEDKLSLEEIGRRAIMIRDHNNQRIVIKNLIADLLGCSVKEIKKDHLSE